MEFLLIFTIYVKFSVFSEKNQLNNLHISEVIDSKKCGYLNAQKLLF